jgi:multicomponent Na+:H+ antiporter subunit E
VTDSLLAFFPRFVSMLAFWLILDGGKLAGVIIGLPSAALAAWLSIKLAPPACGYISPVGSLFFCVHSLWGSLVAGVDVAIRALHPRLPLHTGFVASPAVLLPVRDTIFSWPRAA